ncbi:uncharacterized protein AB675_4119 [Cyphellophora attinorum]|uniref:Uncharacterized protein n=1 Tax=Cyphellophora attinorum TaxID=1664694 RepID=A0A0N0NL13_9EURO|nr:uncharacterized protein AB675_4119 [Phialophora attinorum]KPI38499.1 hypothetical protein AB675_4119 [Phialophora attinorum]
MAANDPDARKMQAMLRNSIEGFWEVHNDQTTTTIALVGRELSHIKALTQTATCRPGSRSASLDTMIMLEASIKKNISSLKSQRDAYQNMTSSIENYATVSGFNNVAQYTHTLSVSSSDDIEKLSAEFEKMMSLAKPVISDEDIPAIIAGVNIGQIESNKRKRSQSTERGTDESVKKAKKTAEDVKEASTALPGLSNPPVSAEGTSPKTATSTTADAANATALPLLEDRNEILDDYDYHAGSLSPPPFPRCPVQSTSADDYDPFADDPDSGEDGCHISTPQISVEQEKDYSGTHSDKENEDGDEYDNVDGEGDENDHI